MTNRDRDGRRLPRQARDAAWTEWPADQDQDLGGYELSDAESTGDLPAWADDEPPARRTARPSDYVPRPRSHATRKGDPNRATMGRGRLLELSRALSGGRARRGERTAIPEPEYSADEPVADWWQEPEEWQSQGAQDQPSAGRRVPQDRSASRGVPTRRSGRDAYARSRPPRSAPTITVPPAIARAAIFHDPMLLGIVGVTAASLALMTAVVGNRMGEMPPGVVLHFNAAGVPDLWGTRETLWRLPLAATMLSVMNVIAGAFMLDRDAFLARFLVASSVLVNVLAWIAVSLIFW